MPQLVSQDISEIDSWLESLFQCKQLDEELIKKLCEKVPSHPFPFYTFFHSVSPFPFLGERSSCHRVQCAVCPMSSYYLWRHSWPISRFNRAIQNRW